MESDVPRAKHWVLLAVVTHIVLGSFRLGSESVWLDELMSIQMAAGTWDNLWRWFRFLPEQHPFYYLLLRPWLAVFGESATALRSFSLLCGAAAVPALYVLGSELVNHRTGLVAAGLLALSPFWLFYSQEGRMYTLLVLLVCWSTLLFVRHLRQREQGSRSRLWTYWTVSVLGMYTHFFFGFVLLAHASAYLLTSENRREGVVGILRLGVPIFLAYLPWAYLLAVGLSGEQDWKSFRTVVFAVPYTLVRFAVGYGTFVANYRWQDQVAELLRDNSTILGLAAVSHAILVVRGLWAWRSLHASSRTVLAIGLTLPLLLPLVLSAFTILAGERYFMVVLPFYLIALATGLSRPMWPLASARWIGALGVAGLVGTTIYALHAHYFNPEAGKEQWYDVAAYLEASVGPGEPVYVAPAMSRAGLLYHSTALSADAIIGLNPESGLQHAPPQSETAWLVVARLVDPALASAALAARWTPVESTLYPKTTGLWVIRLRARTASEIR